MEDTHEPTHCAGAAIYQFLALPVLPLLAPCPASRSVSDDDPSPMPVLVADKPPFATLLVAC